MSQLPDKPSDLIELALADLTAVEAQPEVFKVLMDYWLVASEGPSICYVCLAGAVMVGTLRCGHDISMFPNEIGDPDTRIKLCALNKFREGRIDIAFEYMRLKLPSEFSGRRNIIEYELYPAKFKRDMQELANDLREYGL